MYLLSLLEGISKEVSSDRNWEDSEKASREATLAGQEEHQEEASPIQDG